MAGLVRGIVARRRRVHHTNNDNTNSTTCSNISSYLTSTRYAFSLFSNYSSAASFLGQRRSRTYGDDEMWKLGALAREAKERLDAKLKSKTTSSIIREEEKRMKSKRSIMVKKQVVLRREVFGRRNKKKKGKAKRLIAKLLLLLAGWKTYSASKEHQQPLLEECAVCLSEFKVGDDILNLACAHTFHSTCLMPWLHTNAYCPCCRLSIF